MAYFNYHAQIKKLIESGLFVHYLYTENYPRIGKALVLYFYIDGKPVKKPIRPKSYHLYNDLTS